MKSQTFGFGVDPTQTQNHFYVWIASNENQLPPFSEEHPHISQYADKSNVVQVYERFSWTGEDEQILEPVDRLRIEISKHKWNEVKDALSTEFNYRLKKDGQKTGKFPTKGSVTVERLFGKEMMVLLWAIEDCDPSVISTAVRNWKGLLPEERWWLYTMTNAATGELNDKKGWRKALRFALCENPVVERKQMTMFDDLVS